MKTNQKILIVVIGSLSDIQPFVTLAYGLADSGYCVGIVSHASVLQFISNLPNNNIEFFPLDTLPSLEQEYSSVEYQQIFTASRTIINSNNSNIFIGIDSKSIIKLQLDTLFSLFYSKFIEQNIPMIIYHLASSNKFNASVLIGNNLTKPFLLAIGQRLRLPVTIGNTSPYTYPSSYVLPAEFFTEHQYYNSKLCGCFNLYQYKFIKKEWAKLIGISVDKFRISIGLEPYGNINPNRNILSDSTYYGNYIGPLFTRTPELNFYPCCLVQRPLDYPSWVAETGFIYLDTSLYKKKKVQNSKLYSANNSSDLLVNQQRNNSYINDVISIGDSRLSLFLARTGSRPLIYLNLSFVPISQADLDTLLSMFANVASKMSLRGIVCGTGITDGYLASASRHQHKHVLLVRSEAAEACLANCSVAIHDGSSYNVSLALRAGVPSIIYCTFGEQIFWAHRLAALGIAPPFVTYLNDFSTSLLEKQLLFALSSEVHDRAISYGRAVLTENGMNNAISLISYFISAEHNPGIIYKPQQVVSTAQQCPICYSYFYFWSSRQKCMSCGNIVCSFHLKLSPLTNFDTDVLVCQVCWKKITGDNFTDDSSHFFYYFFLGLVLIGGSVFSYSYYENAISRKTSTSSQTPLLDTIHSSFLSIGSLTSSLYKSSTDLLFRLLKGKSAFSNVK